MSINWVMTVPTEARFIKLPNERVLYESPSRTSLEITSPTKGTQSFSAKSDAGVVYVTNQRLVYLPASSTNDFKSFSAPILNLEDSYVRAPFFGANYWVALCKPVPGGGVPAICPAIELRITFRDGGAFDFHSIFEQIKERVSQAYSVVRENSQVTDLTNVDLEQLPAYEPARDLVEEHEGSAILCPVPTRPGRDCGVGVSNPRDLTPDDAPPGYEEAQAQAVIVDLEQRSRHEAERSRHVGERV